MDLLQFLDERLDPNAPQRQLLAELIYKRAVWGSTGMSDTYLKKLAQPYADDPRFDPAWRLDA